MAMASRRRMKAAGGVDEARKAKEMHLELRD